MRRFVVGAVAWAIAGVAFAQGIEASIEKRPGGEDLVIQFPESMQVMDHREVSRLVRIAPAAPLKSCHWADDAELACRFAKPLPLATQYRVTLDPALLHTATGTTLQATPLVVATERPRLFAFIERWEQGRPWIRLRSEHVLTEAAVRAALRLTLDGKVVHYTLRPSQDGHWDTAFAVELPATPRESTLTLTIAPGLRSTNGPLPGTQDQTLLRAIVGEPFQWRGVACGGPTSLFAAKVLDGRLALEGCTPGEAMRLHLSRVPVASDVEAWIAQWPAGIRKLDTGAEGHSYRRHEDKEPKRAPGWFVEFEIPAPHAQVTLPIPALRAENDPGDVLPPVQARIATGEPRSAFSAPFDRTLLLPGTPAPLQVVNAPAQTMHVEGVAADIRSETLRTPEAGDAPRRVPSDVADRALRDGGITLWTPERRRGDFRDAFQAAAPQFDVFVVAGRREVLAWAHDWDTGAPVVNASVELLLQRDGTPQVVASARTDADGRAMLTLPAGFQLPEAPESKDRPDTTRWLVRAEHRAGGTTRRAVLPVAAGSQGLGTLSGHGFGVSDRPVYRAGDTVQWRLWRLERQGAALVPVRPPGPTRMWLVEQYEDSPLLEWEATPDARGAIAGATTIPIHVPDGDYCIGESAPDIGSEVCFHVGAYQAQDLWMRASSPSRLVRDGDTIALDIDAGYYSGGEAAGAAIERIAARLQPSSLGAEYPQWREYTFARPEQYDTHPLEGSEDLAVSADAKGHARVNLPVAFDDDGELPPFGIIDITAEAKLNDREGTVSNVVEVHYARFDRYVGLKLEPRWLDGKSRVRMQAVVVDPHGNAAQAGPIEVEVAYSTAANGPHEPIHRCTLVAGEARDCTFERRRTGYYRITARSGDAAPAEIGQTIWSSSQSVDRSARPKLELVGEEGVIGTPVRLLLHQPGADVPALLVVSSDNAILESRVFRAEAGAHTFELQTRPDWPRNLAVSVYLRGRASTEIAEPGLRQPVETTEVNVGLDFAPAPRTAQPVTVAFEPARTAPADPVRIVLHNTSKATRSVTLAVVDDALRAIGKQWLLEMDPVQGNVFAGYRWDGTSTAGFGSWNRQRWRWLIVGHRDVCGADPDVDGICGPIEVLGSGATHPIDVRSVDSNDLYAVDVRGRPADVRQVALLAPGTVRARADAAAAPAPPAPPEGPPVVFDEASPLDAVKVTPPAEVSPLPQRPDSRKALDLARVRTNFADTALWRTDIVIAPGERRTIEFTAPDNLTRWRAVAWNDDGAGDFAMAEATLEAGLPVEARLQSPVRIYAGDRARIAANVRHTAQEVVEAHVRLDVKRDATVESHPGTLALPAQGQASFAAQLHPDQPGELLVTAAAATPQGQDAVAAPLEVASTTIPAQRTQAGWLQATPLSIKLPTLPEGATNPRLAVSVWRGNHALVHGWTEDMREYPHRCWEQILSRAVAAALALDRADPSWPDARAVVQEALDNAAVFQEDDGQMRFFVQSSEWGAPSDWGTQVPLTAWTVDAFALLRSLGHDVPEAVEQGARDFLAEDHEFERHETNELAIAAAVVDVEDVDLAAIRAQLPKLAVAGRVAGARALARKNDPHAGEAIQSLLAGAPVRAGKRVLAYAGRGDRWMSSPMREQCELIRLLQDFPGLAPEGARLQLVQGLSDLYAGGVPEVDTQTGAACLRALHGERAGDAAAVAVDVTLGADAKRVALEAGVLRSEASFDAPATDALQIAPVVTPASPVAYLARMAYEEDARKAQGSALGLAIERRYTVLRNHRWVPLADTALQEGDWVRVTLAVTTTRQRHFVAVTDDLPGGLRPMDLQLAGVAGVDVQALGDPGDPAFDQRKLDARKPKFYAEILRPGRHEIHYFARVANTGDYLAAPALAELMYGEATRARTASDRIRIEDPPTP